MGKADIDRKQFIISSDRLEKDGWDCVELYKCNRFLYSHQELKKYVSSNGSVIVLGEVWQADPERMHPYDEAEKLSRQEFSLEEVYEMEKTWCGRYVLIVEEYLFLDTAGLLGVFYDEKNISSSLHVMCEVEKRKIVKPKICHGIMPNFIPGEVTEYKGIKRLLPSQVYNIKINQCIIRPLLVKGRTCNSEDEAACEFTRLYTNSLMNMADNFKDKKLCLALTGGHDSRSTMAYLENASVDYETFTLGYEGVSQGDIEIPKMLTDITGKRFRFIPEEKRLFSKERKNEFLTHTAGMAADRDIDFYSNNQYQQLCEGEDVVIIRSSIWECVIDYYKKKVKDVKNPTMKDMMKIYPGLRYYDKYAKSSEKWLELVRCDEINKKIGFCNRALWELRSGCWLSSLEQSFDVMRGITSVQPLNCRIFLYYLSMFDAQKRYKKKHQEELINIVCPSVKEVPYEKEYNKRYQKKESSQMDKIKKKINKYYGLAKNYGMINVCNVYCNQVLNKRKGKKHG